MKKTILSIVLALSTPALFADDLKGKGEFSIYGGGVHVTDGGGNHGVWGLNLGYGIAQHVTLLGEFSHTPLDGAKVHDYMGGVKFNLGGGEKVVPYGLVGIGAGRVSSGSFSDTDFTFHLGGGLRIYASPRWGFAPEIRWVRYISDSSDGNAIRYTGGVFFQW